MARRSGDEKKPAGRDDGGESVSPPAERTLGVVELRLRVPRVVDDALQQYADAVALPKTSAARSILMRVLVKRTMYVPEPLHESPDPAT